MNEKNKNENILAVIPARGGSKRVPGKNIRDLCGKPAIDYTIDAALKSRLFSKIIVSTDSHKIAKIAKAAGAEVPFMRDSEISDDYTPVSEVTADALNRVDPAGIFYKYVAQLMPNCPLRTADDIELSFAQFERHNADSQISVTDYGWQNPWWAMSLNDRNEIKYSFPDKVKSRSQDLSYVFCPTGAIWWIKAEILKEEKNFHTANSQAWVMPWQRAVDIDTEDDWQLAEILMQSHLIERKEHG